ncbi:MAG TPA: plastocyanin/azurin family copper-binding protein [Nitrososphaerales archaeon]|nr:plastocyanin/azurin family copper-binding protein [Nitrososphaerales archaeon]
METSEEEYSPKRILLLLAGVMAVVLVGVGAALAVPLQPALVLGSTSCAQGTTCVEMPLNAAALNFSPDNITVVLGVNNTVQWTNHDSIDHTVVVCPVGGGVLCSPSVAVKSSPLLSKGNTFEVTLNATGVYHFYCSIHPSTMRGTIVVVSGNSSSTST